MPLIPWVKPIPAELVAREAAIRESFARVRLTSGVSAHRHSGNGIVPLILTDLVKSARIRLSRQAFEAEDQTITHRKERTMIIELYKGKGKHPWRWRLLSTNGKIVADSAEGYHNSSNLRRAARRLPIKATIRWA